MRTVFFVPVFFFALSVSAQDQKKEVSQNTKVTVTATPPTTVVFNQRNVTATPPSTVALNERSMDSANLTPEQQGYTKKIVNGKEVYVKEAGQMTFYYEPKK